MREIFPDAFSFSVGERKLINPFVVENLLFSTALARSNRTRLK
jgi:hypothetical protein